jgi:predicted Zn-dependent protease
MRLLCALLVSTQIACGHAHSAPPITPTQPPADIILDAIEHELSRALPPAPPRGRKPAPKAGLRLDDYDPPYFVAFRVKDTRRVQLAAKNGAVVVDEQAHNRRAAADVRVGTYAFDNSNDPDVDWVETGVYQPSNVLPVDDSRAAIRHTLWLLADFRYKQALASFLKLKGQGVYRLEDPTRGPSFSTTPSVVHIAAIPTFAHDRDRWASTVRALSARLASDPRIFDSEVSFETSLDVRWLGTSEGTRLRDSRLLYMVRASAWTQAEDGMLIEHSYHAYAPTEATLPSSAELDAGIDGLKSTLLALRVAPVLEPFTGPAILDPTATGVLFHEILGHRLEGHRHDDQEDGQTFARYLGQPILPTFISLVDDPTLLVLANTPLNGAYAHDEEGVLSERVTLVDRGVLRSFLNARRPGPGATRSNGHGRAEGVRHPVARQANLVVVAHETVSRPTLDAMLLAEVRRQGKPFGLIIKDLAGGQTNTSSYGYQAFKGEARTVYKVDAVTGVQTLVRGVDLVGTPLTTIGKIMAASDEVGVFNGFCGAESGMVPVSASAPATLFSEVELQRSMRPRARPPVLPNPYPAPSLAPGPAPRPPPRAPTAPTAPWGPTGGRP